MRRRDAFGPASALTLVLIPVLALAPGASCLAQSGGGPPPAGIVIDGGTVMPVDDPVYEIDFRVSLAPGYEVATGSTLDILQVPFGTDFTSINSTNWTITDGVNGASPSLDPSFTLTFAPADPNQTITATAATGPIYLFDFVVLTTIDTSLPPATIESDLGTLTSTPIDYNSTSINTSTGMPDRITGNSITVSVVPEPSGLFLVAVGLAVTGLGRAGWVIRRGA